MAKTNISFNNKNYTIPDESLSTASASLRNHLSTVMNGTGATINLGGTAYSVDSAKLSAATNDFTSYLRTVAGTGYKVNVGGVEYGVDATKVAGAITELETVLGGLNNPSGEERLEGDGQEFHKFAPTALTFRSTAPLNELQEVQINGVTVDPSNYTLEEGSTVVTLPIEYLKTLDVDNYEISVVSDSKTAKGGFNVVQPELNEHGFYYNQPYTAYVDMFGENESFFIREDGTLDVVGTPSGDVSQCTYTCSGNQMTVVSPVLGTLTAAISDDGTEIFCNELQIAFTLGNESIAADDDYIYIYKEDLGGYMVTIIDKTKTEYPPIRIGVNGMSDVVAIGEYAFSHCENLTSINIPEGVTHIGHNAFHGNSSITSINIPNSVIFIGVSFIECSGLTSINIPAGVTYLDMGTFDGCSSLMSITFNGTIAQWNAMSKDSNWNRNCVATYVQCSDGQVAL